MGGRRLIINADDCNLTSGVTRGILEAHDRGVVSSTTLLMNRPLSSQTVREIKKRKRLGLGVHLNVTLGEPLSPRPNIPTLLQPDGRFRRPPDYEKKRPRIREVVREYEAQIRRFEKHFGERPGHLDTHHHLHDDPVFFQALKTVAKKWNVPVRRSRVFLLEDYARGTAELKTTDHLFGNLEANYIWQQEPFFGVVRNLPEGTSEIGCHPGHCDRELKAVSSMKEVREREWQLFSNPSLRKVLSSLGIELICFSDL